MHLISSLKCNIKDDLQILKEITFTFTFTADHLNLLQFLSKKISFIWSQQRNQNTCNLYFQIEADLAKVKMYEQVESVFIEYVDWEIIKALA